ncbi:MAG TPA: hypothetical protein VNY07_10780 [Chthoniobacterales bacterium]|nr:hypothetical protein [Chthoniobacterales bacterium]
MGRCDPKDFLQCLTLEHVKALWRNGETVRDAALNAGLSGPGRLHDLCVALDAASPGEMKDGGGAIEIKYGFATTPSGEALIGETSRGISRLSCVDGQGRNGARDLLANEWPDAKLHRTDQRAKELSATIFRAAAKSIASEVGCVCARHAVSAARVAGAPARASWLAHQLRSTLGGDRSPGASRAVGSAVGAIRSPSSSRVTVLLARPVSSGIIAGTRSANAP